MAIIDRTMICLDRALARLDALTRQLAESEGELVDQAARAVGGLPPISACGDVERLLAGAELPTDPEARASIQALQTQLAEVETMVRLGRYPDGLKAASEAVSAAEATDYGPLIAEDARGARSSAVQDR